MEVRKSITIAQPDEFGISWNVSEKSDRVLGSEPGILEFIIPAGAAGPLAVVYGTMDLEVPLEVTGMCRIIGNPVPIIFYHPLKITCFDFLLSNAPDIALVTLRRSGTHWEIPPDSSIIIGRESKHTFGAFSDSNMTALTVTRALTVVSSYIHFYGETIVRNIYSYIGSDGSLDLALSRVAETVRQLSERIHIATCHSPVARKSSDQDIIHPLASNLWTDGAKDLTLHEKCLIIDKTATIGCDQTAFFSGGVGSVIFFDGNGAEKKSNIKCTELHLTSQGCIFINSRMDCSVSLTCASQQKTYVMSGTQITCGIDGKFSNSLAMSLSAAQDIQCVESELNIQGRSSIDAHKLSLKSVQITSQRSLLINAVVYRQENSKIVQLSKEDTLKMCANFYEHLLNSESTSNGDLHLEFIPTVEQKNQTSSVGECFKNHSSRIYAARDVLLRLRLAGFGQIIGQLEGGGNMRIECADLGMEKESIVRVDGNLFLNCSKFQSTRKSRLSVGGYCDLSMQKGAQQLGRGVALF